MNEMSSPPLPNFYLFSVCFALVFSLEINCLINACCLIPPLRTTLCPVSRPSVRPQSTNQNSWALVVNVQSEGEARLLYAAAIVPDPSASSSAAVAAAAAAGATALGVGGGSSSASSGGGSSGGGGGGGGSGGGGAEQSIEASLAEGLRYGVRGEWGGGEGGGRPSRGVCCGRDGYGGGGGGAVQ